MTLTSIPIEDLQIDDVFYLQRYGAINGPGRRVVTVNPLTYVRVEAPLVAPYTQNTLVNVTAVYVERDDETAPDETTPEAASPEDEDQAAIDISRRLTEAHDDGVREGYLKAQQETTTTVGYDHATRPRFIREDALVLAVQAVGGTEHVMNVVSLAEQIERYVNVEQQPTYPHADGEFTVLGPGVFASEDRAVLNWDGVNYVPQTDAPQADAHPTAGTEFPSVIETHEDAELGWPEGTRVADNEGDVFVRKGDGWYWIQYADGSDRPDGWSGARFDLDASLRPARVVNLGGAS